VEKTFAMIKPHAVQDGHAENIMRMIESAGFEIAKKAEIIMTRAQAEDLYQEHKGRSFYDAMVEEISTRPVVVMVLAKDNAVSDWRDLMGPTNPAEAAAGTIRAIYGKNIGENATHGSDSLQSSQREQAIFFSESCCSH
jgi:nucleoside-diphosphate kinase